MPSVWGELKRRNVFRVAIAYVVIAWLILQVGGTLAPALRLPDWVNTLLVFFLILGFPMAVFFAWAYELTPQGIRKEEDIDRDGTVVHPPGRKLDYLIIGLLSVAVFVFAFDRFVWTEDAAPATAANSEQPTIAVLPFINMSADPEQEYFSDGLAEELLHLLTRIPELRVTSRSSAFSYKGKDFKIADVGRELGVSYVLEGSVRRADDTLRITAQLIDVDTDAHLWSETWDRTFNDIFIIQDEIARSVVDALKVNLLGDAPEVPETKPEAYVLYLQARSLTYQHNADSLLRAESLIKRALEIDDAYVAAWVQLAQIYYFGAAQGSWEPHESFPLARAAAMQALRRDANNARAHAALSSIAQLYDLDMATAREQVQMALALAPNDTVVQEQAAFLASASGDYERMISFGEEAVLRDPLNLDAKMTLGFAYFYSGRINDAMSSFRQMIALDPAAAGAHARLGQLLLISGEYDAALDEVAKEPRNGTRLATRALILHAKGDSEAASRELDALIALGNTWTYEIAMVHAYRGNADEAFTWLGRAIDRRDQGLANILGDPFMDQIRDDPRFEDVLIRLGLKPEP